MKLPPAWEAIVDEIRAAALQRAKLNNLQILDQGAVRDAVERCFALANKPARELTDKQWREIYIEGCKAVGSMEDVAKAWASAYQRKQQETETVTFRAARNRNDHSEIYMAKADSDWSGSNWEWLPGEPQTIEVKLP